MTQTAVPIPRRSLVFKTIWSAFNGTITTFGMMVTTVITARVLGAKGLGELSYMMWLASFVATFTNFGLSASLSRYLPELHATDRSEDADRLLWWVARWTLLATFLGAGVILAIGMVFSEVGSAATWIVLACLFVIQTASNYFNSYWTGQQQFHKITKVAVPGTVLQIAGIAAGCYWLGVPGALLGYLLGQAIPFVLSIRLLMRIAGAGRLSPELTRRIWIFAINTWLAAVVSAFVWSRTEFFFLKLYRDEHAVAMFASALGLVGLAQIAPLMLCSALTPYFSEKTAVGDHASLQRVYQSVIKLMALILFPTCLFLAATSSMVVPLFYGQGFEDAIRPTSILMIASTLSGLGAVAAAVVYSAEKSRYILVSNGVAAVFALGGAVLLISQFGVVGAALLRGTIQVAMLVAGFVYVWVVLGYKLPLRELLLLWGASAIAAVTAAVAVRLYPNAASLPVAFIAAVLTFLGTVRWLRVLTVDDRLLFDRLLNRLPKACAKLVDLVVPVASDRRA